MYLQDIMQNIRPRSGEPAPFVQVFRIWLLNENEERLTDLLHNTGVTKSRLLSALNSLETMTSAYSDYLLDYIFKHTPGQTTEDMLTGIMLHPGNSVKSTMIRAGLDTAQLWVNLGKSPAMPAQPGQNATVNQKIWRNQFASKLKIPCFFSLS